MQKVATRSAGLSEKELWQLNEQYIAAYMQSDVHWYELHLSDDFVCIEPDGTVLGKAAFLDQTAKGPDVIAYELERVQVRIYGVTALVQATGLFTRKNGSKGKSRYTDFYVWNGDEWKVVSAQVTRTVNSEQ